MIEAPKFATAYSHSGKQFLGRWWPSRGQMLEARSIELAVEPSAKVVATVKGWLK